MSQPLDGIADNPDNLESEHDDDEDSMLSVPPTPPCNHQNYVDSGLAGVHPHHDRRAPSPHPLYHQDDVNAGSMDVHDDSSDDFDFSHETQMIQHGATIAPRSLNTSSV